MAEPQSHPATIELRVERLAHLFDPLDPFPVPSRDLAKTAEDFIVGWARELPPGADLALVIHVPSDEMHSEDAAGLREAIGRHFAYRAERVRGDLHELFRIGRVSLAVGVCVLAACVVFGWAVGSVLEEPFRRFFTEGLFILGWVANWRPMEIFFYDWWPLRARRKLYLRLASAPVGLQPLA
jgi:hypothetical protein